MSISVGNDITSVMSRYNESTVKNSKTAGLEKTLKSDLSKASDEELMDACKSFEAYLIEQVMTKVKDAVAPSDDDENQYMTMFGDKLYQEYAKMISDSDELGLAQKLFEAMKRDYGKNVSSENTTV